MLVLALKIVLAPLLVAVASGAQHRWGQSVGGRVVGLPLTSVPLLFLLALAQGSRFAAMAAGATLAGVSGQAVLTWTYARAAPRRTVGVTLVAAVASFALSAAVLDVLAPGPLPAAVLATIVTAVLLHRWPTPPDPAPCDPARHCAPHHERSLVATRGTTTLRMVLAAIFAIGVSELSSPLGPRLAGLVTALPVLSLVMLALTHRDDGPAEVAEFAHGVQRGTYSVITALLVLTLALPTGHVVLAFGSALAASVLAQVASGPHRGAHREATSHPAP